MNTSISGRRREQQLLENAMGSPEAELIAIYGRRRVGKTHLVREFFEPRADLYFSVTGEKDGPKKTQLHHFQREMERAFYDGRPIPRIRSWDEAFELLTTAVERHHATSNKRSSQIVIFLDELPWLATPRSGLTQALDHHWNTSLSRRPEVCLVVCGSAASWMLDKLINAKGGLHNRITRRIRLEAFSLLESQQFLDSRGIKLTRAQVMELYMALGGVPHYLKMIERGRSATQNIAALCFDRDGQLHDEFNRLYASLFSEAAVYERTVRALSARKSGVTRAELLSTLGISSGGRLAGRLRELEEAGFIARLPPVYTRKKNAIYRLIDEHSLFFFKWIEPAPRGILATGGAAYWQAKAQSPGYKAWAGYAFEGICLKHVDRIKQSLGIDGMAAEVGTWRYVPPKGAGGSGAQIDLLFDRSDDTITLCECKYSADRYTITKGYARELKEKVAVFEARTKTKKQVQLCLITPHGMKQNTWSEDLIDQVVTSDDLFDEAI